MRTSLINTDELKLNAGHPQGSRWTVNDERALAHSIAQIALGQWRHLESILANARIISPALPVFSGSAKDLLVTLPGTEPWHRDGWLFQCISWIAAAESGVGPLRPPHSIWADKGFDGLQLVLSPSGDEVERLVVFEDKATSDPRGTVRDEVWPEFEQMARGDRNHDLVSELSALLDRVDNLDVRQATDRVFREGGLSFRLAITIADPHNSDAGISRLFKGYEDKVPGGHSRRFGHVLYLSDLRTWMQALADLAIEELDALEKLDQVANV
ncbi:hypothetical protein [Microterricola gilva]|uniref:hypothetical protein n=1 Tax=Microterricola gilva TaxID=393267 RepID=UPI00102BD744|nr:hypothetical protein [Microterricola gilva]